MNSTILSLFVFMSIQVSAVRFSTNLHVAEVGPTTNLDRLAAASFIQQDEAATNLQRQAGRGTRAERRTKRIARLRRRLARLKAQKRARKMRTLDYHSADDVAHRALAFTNEFRGANNLPDVTWSPELAKIAQEHAEQMARGVVPFDDRHVGCEERFQRIRSIFGPREFLHKGAAENLGFNVGYNDPAKSAVEGWIESPSHCKALKGHFTMCGIGVARSGDEYFFTQLFANITRKREENV